jgi:hypothetical protein
MTVKMVTVTKPVETTAELEEEEELAPGNNSKIPKNP